MTRQEIHLKCDELSAQILAAARRGLNELVFELTTQLLALNSQLSHEVVP